MVGTGIGVRLADGGDERSAPVPATTVGLALPIEYPVGHVLPDLGNTPGPLAAIWLAPPVGGRAPDAVGLVAETGTYGTLPIDLPRDDPEAPTNVGLALSPDGRRVAYQDATGQPIVRDLVSGRDYSSGSGLTTRVGFMWTDPTTLIGHVAGGGDMDGWVWQPGTSFRLVNRVEYVDQTSPDISWFARSDNVGPGSRDWWVADAGGGPRSCSSPLLDNGRKRFGVPMLCDVLGVMPGILLGHWNDGFPGDWDDEHGTVVGLDGAFPWAAADPRVVVAAGAPERVTFATDLIGEALDADGGGS